MTAGAAHPTAPEPRVSFADTDHATAVAQAVATLQREGVVVLDDFVAPDLIARCKGEIKRSYPDLAKVDRERNYGPYEGRHCMPMRIEGTLADRAIFIPRSIEDIAETLLGQMFMIDSIGLLVAIPGAPDQKGHADGHLYTEQLDRMLPPFALALAMPLVRMDEISGRTAFWRGTHRKAAVSELHDYAPIVDPGSAILWDFRVKHGGLANRSDAPRPVIFTVLSRDWWVEIQPPEATRYEKFLVAREVQAGLKPRLQQRIRRAVLTD